jgi:hypothetical protein
VGVPGRRKPGFLKEILGARAGQAGEEAPDALAMACVDLVEGAGLPAAQGEHQVAIAFHTRD